MLMKYPFFISKISQDSAIYSIQKLLQYYHIMEETKNIKQACNAYEEAINTQNIVSCLHQYNIEAKEVTNALEYVKVPCILYCYYDPTYLFIYKKCKKYYKVDSFYKGKCKIKAAELAIPYKGRYLEIQHVGRVKKVSRYTTFWKFLRTTMIKYTFFITTIILFSVIYTSLLIGASQLFVTKELYHPRILIMMLYLIANMVLAIKYVLNNILLLLSQLLIKKYVHQQIINRTVNDKCDLQSKQAMRFIVNIMQWIRICSIDVIVWLGILGLTILRYRIIGTVLNIGIIWCCLLYNYYHPMGNKHKSLDTAIFSKWDMYIKNQHYLYQFQYQKSYTSDLDKQFAIKQQEQLVRTIRKNRLTWLFGVVIIMFIGGMFWLWVWLLESNIISFWHIILLFIIQLKTVANIIRVIQMSKGTKHIFEGYKELQTQPMLQTLPLSAITDINLHHIRSISLKYFDLQINHSMCIQGKQEEIENIFNIIIGKQLTYQGSVYVNNKLLTPELILSIQNKVIVLEKKPLFLEESVSYHLFENALVKRQALFLLNTFHMEDIAANLEVVLDNQGNPLTLEQKQIVMLIRAILLKPNVILLNNGLSAIDTFRYERILVYLQTCLPNTIVVIFDCFKRKVPSLYQKVRIKEGRVI